MVEGIKIAGRMSAIGGTLISIGVPYDIITDYEAAIEADSFLVMAHGSADDVAWAKAILACPWRCEGGDSLPATEAPLVA